MQVPLFQVSCGTKSSDWKWNGGRRFQSLFSQSWIAFGSAVSLTQSGTGNQTCCPTRSSHGWRAQSEPTHWHAECQSCYKYTQLPPISLFPSHTHKHTHLTWGHNCALTSASPSPERTCNYTLTRNWMNPGLPGLRHTAGLFLFLLDVSCSHDQDDGLLLFESMFCFNHKSVFLLNLGNMATLNQFRVFTYTFSVRLR